MKGSIIYLTAGRKSKTKSIILFYPCKNLNLVYIRMTISCRSCVQENSYIISIDHKFEISTMK